MKKEDLEFIKENLYWTNKNPQETYDLEYLNELRQIVLDAIEKYKDHKKRIALRKAREENVKRIINELDSLANDF